METLRTELAVLSFKGVLIVPCGMETVSNSAKADALTGINCTLRNGNCDKTLQAWNPRAVLIVPCGMETPLWRRLSYT